MNLNEDLAWLLCLPHLAEGFRRVEDGRGGYRLEVAAVAGAPVEKDRPYQLTALPRARGLVAYGPVRYNGQRDTAIAVESAAIGKRAWFCVQGRCNIREEDMANPGVTFASATCRDAYMLTVPDSDLSINKSPCQQSRPPDLDWLWRDLEATAEEHFERYVDILLEQPGR